MYVCKDCGSTFYTPHFKKSKSECPDCGSDNFVEAEQCPICREWFVGAPLQHYCNDCKWAAEEQLRRAVDRMVDTDFIELLCDEYTDLDFIIKGDEDD